MLTLLVAVAAQAGAVTDTIAGTVTGPGGQPVAGVIVQATSTVSGLSRWQTSNVAGRFTIYFPGRPPYRLIAYYFGLVRGPGIVPVWARDDTRAANIRLELAGIDNPIDTILARYGVLGLTGDQVTRLRGIAASTNSFTLPELERVRSILTASQWSRLSTERLPAAAPRPQAVSAASASRAPAVPPADPSRARAQPQVPPRKPTNLMLYTAVSTVYENNLNHTPTPLESYGLLAGGGGEFRGRWSHTSLELQYDGVFRRYTGTDLWNVPGHAARVAVSQRMTRRWAAGAEVGIQLNGSSEDRVLRNEYSAEANVEYRLTSTSRLQLYGEYMLKRYPNPGRNSADPRVGLKYRTALGARGTWGAGGRYNYNRADSTRRTYNGWTATTDLALGVGKGGRISASFRYNLRRYPYRLVTLPNGDVLREDADRVATVAWQQEVNRAWQAAVGYRYENYDSNDPSRRFQAGMVVVTLTRFW